MKGVSRDGGTESTQTRVVLENDTATSYKVNPYSFFI